MPAERSRSPKEGSAAKSPRKAAPAVDPSSPAMDMDGESTADGGTASGSGPPIPIVADNADKKKVDDDKPGGDDDGKKDDPPNTDLSASIAKAVSDAMARSLTPAITIAVTEAINVAVVPLLAAAEARTAEKIAGIEAAFTSLEEKTCSRLNSLEQSPRSTPAGSDAGSRSFMDAAMFTPPRPAIPLFGTASPAPSGIPIQSGTSSPAASFSPMASNIYNYSPFSPTSTAFPGVSPPTTGFDRAVDPGILKFSCSELVKLEEATRALKAIVIDAGLNEQNIEIDHNPLSSQHVLRFKVEAATAARYVTQLLAAQRLDKFTWKRHECKSAEGKPVDFFINPDKSAKTVRTEIQTKKLQAILKSAHDGRAFECRSRAAGVITTGWRQLVKVDVIDEHSTILRWNLTVLATTPIDKSAIANDFIAATGTGDPVQWV